MGDYRKGKTNIFNLDKNSNVSGPDRKVLRSVPTVVEKEGEEPAKFWGVDLLPGRPSFITRVLLVDSRPFQVGQARRARCCQVAQALGVLLPGFCSQARNAA